MVVGKVCDVLNQKVHGDIELGRAAEVNTIFHFFLFSRDHIFDDVEGLQVMPYNEVSQGYREEGRW